jgi:hypothetical protein
MEVLSCSSDASPPSTFFSLNHTKSHYSFDHAHTIHYPHFIYISKAMNTSNIPPIAIDGLSAAAALVGEDVAALDVVLLELPPAELPLAAAVPAAPPSTVVPGRFLAALAARAV